MHWGERYPSSMRPGAHTTLASVTGVFLTDAPIASAFPSNTARPALYRRASLAASTASPGPDDGQRMM
jgi:hypothetical protein